MAQRIKIGKIGGSGITVVLIISGVVLTYFNIYPKLGKVAIFGGIIIALIYGFLGALGIIKKLKWR